MKKCGHCGVEFSNKGATKYCSQECYHASRAKTKVVTCEACGNEFMQRNPGSRFCSKACAAKYRVPPGRWGGRVVPSTKKCGLCKRDFPNSGRSNFCSPECRNESRRAKQHKAHMEKRPVIMCVGCGKEISIRPSCLGRMYCSVECTMKSRGMSGTRPELLAESILSGMGLDYISQFRIRSSWCVDFLVSQNIVLQIDGEYWHGHPRFEPLSEAQIKQRNRDERLNETLEAMGYKVYRLWENEITQERISEIISESKGT